MTNPPIDETEKLFEELQGFADNIELEMALEQIAMQSIVELKQIEMNPIFDEYYGAKKYSEILEKGSKKPVLRDPKGGLTAAGRAYFKRKEGANLKPGVRGAANTPEKMRRKGSFLTRFFTNPSGPMKDEKGRATRLALSAAAWGEPVPQNMDDARKLAAKGRRMLERYQNTKKKKSDSELDVLNKTAAENYFSYLSSWEAKGLTSPENLFLFIEEDLETEIALRSRVRESLIHLSPSSKSDMSYMPNNEEELERMKKASKMMKNRRKKKNG